MPFKTYAPKPDDIKREWWVIDAQGQTLGRLANQIAMILRGKHKANYTPNTDMGDHVIVINCDKIHVTGRRLDQKYYYRYSGYPSGLKATRLRDQMKTHPDRVIYLAVRGMLPKNSLGRKMLTKLRVYAGSEHPHEAQHPKPLEVKDNWAATIAQENQ
jgi:large subunit ribosomal protein L13